MSDSNPLRSDLESIAAQVNWDELRGNRIFVAGGTGFFGCWLLESFLWANRELKLGASAVVLTRNAKGFQARKPHLAGDPAATLVEGDVRDFDFPAGSFSHIINAATPASAALNAADPMAMLDTIIGGARRVLDLAAASGARKLLFTSSGAVYGDQPSDMTHIPESYPGMPDTMNPGSAYAEGKRTAELLCAIYHRTYGIETKIARCFAFAGPGLPLDAHFAAGNFIHDRLKGGPIRVQGDGTPYRSYLYAADLAVWLWSILFRGEACRPYNVGSSQAVSIGGLAEMTAALPGGPGEEGIEVRFAQQAMAGVPARRYVPDVTRAETELGLRPTVPTAEGLRRTLEWARKGCAA
ncbi:MAG: NAD-dependent epimerase/dehydratase family protein [Acidobacteriota bacterium]|nr:NAD-dependent epimerase/dehydratase family protein [Acidobacteriota bacterium]